MPDITGTDLLIYYFGVGYVLFLAWGIVVGDAAKPRPPRWVRPATVTLQVVGLVHPAAALAAWDVRRALAGDEPAPSAGPAVAALGVVASLVFTVAVVVTAGL